MRVVALVGSKGGTGKSTLAHALAFGATLRAGVGVMVHTDHRPPVGSTGRPYGYVDGRDPERLVQVLEKAHAHDGLLVIDGGGNRPAFDRLMAQAVDLVLIPVTLNAEDLRLAVQDLERLPTARVVFNRWPLNPFTRIVAERYEASLPRERYLGRLIELGSVRRFLEDGGTWTPLPTKVHHFARALYGMVQKALGEKPL
jgi:hypothetical protein